MILVYNYFIGFYYLIVKVSSFFNEKAKKLLEGQLNSVSELNSIEISNQIIWFHCASVGEFEQGYPLLNKIRNEFPYYKFLITFYSPSGYDFVKNKYPNELISYLPIDTKKSMSKFIEKVNPKLVFIVKYEFWFHLLNELKNRQIPVFLVSGIFRKNQSFFKPVFGNFFVKILRNFDFLFLQDSKSKELLNSVNIVNTAIAGDTRFDRVLENKETSFKDEVIEKFVKGHKIFVAGSCWNEDLEVIKSIINNLPKDWKIILVPHEINSFKTDWINEKYQTYSTFQSTNDRILLIDKMGLLSKLYRYSNLNYIGGGFGKSIHNILEPAVFGKPILIGPNYHKFLEAKYLVSQKCVFEVNNALETEIVVKNLLKSESILTEIEQKLNLYITENTNVSAKIIVYLKDNGYLKMQ